MRLSGNNIQPTRGLKFVLQKTIRCLRVTVLPNHDKSAGLEQDRTDRTYATYAAYTTYGAWCLG